MLPRECRAAKSDSRESEIRKAIHAEQIYYIQLHSVITEVNEKLREKWVKNRVSSIMYVLLLFVSSWSHALFWSAFSSNTLFCFGQWSIHFTATPSTGDGFIQYVALLWCGRDTVCYVVQDALDRVMLVSLCRIAARDSNRGRCKACSLLLIQY